MLGLTGWFLFREGAFASGDALVRSLSTPISVGWWGLGIGLMVGVLWAAKQESSWVLGAAAWLGGAVGATMGWLTHLPGKSVQKALVGHEILALVLLSIGLGVLLASALLGIRGGVFTERSERSVLYAVHQNNMIALVLLGGAFLTTVFWGWQPDLLQRMGRVFVVFALTSVIWMPLHRRNTKESRDVSSDISMGWVLWFSFVALSVLSWMILWMLSVV